MSRRNLLALIVGIALIVIAVTGLSAQADDTTCWFDDGYATGFDDARAGEAVGPSVCPPTDEWEAGYWVGFYDGIRTSVPEGSGHPYEFLGVDIDEWPKEY